MLTTPQNKKIYFINTLLILKDGFMTIVEIFFPRKNEFLADRPVFKIDF